MTPGSRTPSPAAKEDQSSNGSDGVSSANDEQANNHRRYACPSVQYHPGLTLPNPYSPMHHHETGSAKNKFKYVKPRLGSNFQAKIGAYQPKRSSEDSDDLNVSVHAATSSTASTATSGPKKKRAGRPPKGGKTKQPESTEMLTYDPGVKSERGGLCIHRPSPIPLQSESYMSTFKQKPPTTHDEYLTFCRNLTLQTPKDYNHSIARADHLWKTALEQDKYRSLEAIVVQEKKRGRKRKLEKSESGVSIATSIDSNVSGGNGNVSKAVESSTSQSHSPVSMDLDDGNGSGASVDERADVGTDNTNYARGGNVALGLEDDDGMLEYLQVNGSGNLKRAQLMMMVELCRGTAVRTRRRIRKAKKEDNLAVPLSAVLAPLSDSWRRRYERIGTTIIGDHRRNPGRTKYPYFDHGDSSSSSVYPWTRNWDSDKCNTSGNSIDLKTNAVDDTIHQSINANWGNFESIMGDEGLMNAWACILEKGQLILVNHKNGHKPVFADLFVLLNKAYSMPKPEDVYQKRDTMPKQVSQCLNSILDFVENGKEILAHIVDAMYDDGDNGIELQSLKKILDSKNESCSVQLEEIGIAREMLNETMRWESQLTPNGREESSSSEDLHLPQQSLSLAESLARKGRDLSLRPNSLALLESRIQRAYDLRNRIRLWSKNNGNEKDSVKYIGSMIKEANKINLSFQELSLLSKVHRNAEEWIDRANVALRSKISLGELESLVKTGENMPLGLTASLGKLQSRYKQVCEWISALKVEVPCPLESMGASGCDLDAGNRAEWLLRMRNTLKAGSEESVQALLDLSSQGSRLPVEIDFLQLLQTAIDARNWSQKARRWVPSAGDQFRRGKIEDLQDHLESAGEIINKAKKMTEGKADWQLDYAAELQSTVDTAEAWFQTYEPYLTGDNRRANSRNSISYNKLLQIVEEAEQIPSNLGNPFIKINRIFCEAKDWMETNRILLQRCGVEFGQKSDAKKMKPVSIDEVNSAIESAAKELAVDLDEVTVLKKMAEQSQDWFDQALKFAPKRNKRVVGSKRESIEKCTMDTVISLIESASNIPMDTSSDVGRLRLLLSDVQSWRLESQIMVRDIASAIRSLVKERNDFYGEPRSFLEEEAAEPMDLDEENVVSKESSSPYGVSNDSAPSPSASGNALSSSKADNIGNDVYKMVQNLHKSTDALHILTFEEEIVKRLDVIMKWCKKVSFIVDSYEDVFVDKRWKHDLDTLITETSDMNLDHEKFTVPMPDDGEENKIFNEVSKSVFELISAESARLSRLQAKRDEYYSWCKKATDSYIESDRRVPHETLLDLAKECSIYPPNAETVKRITKDAKATISWIADVKKILGAGQKMTLEEVKSKLNKLSRVKITCNEYRSLRKAHQNAKNWSAKVKKSGLHNGTAQIHELKDLLREHDELIIAVPEDFEELKQTLCGYCICRRPYEGFMIGCDECKEWYHGPCIGVSQAQSDRMEKYVCVRCCVKRVYKISSNKIAQIVRKWCDPKDLSKARSQDNQKHQRKIREKKRDIVKLKEECQASVSKLQKLKAQKIEMTSAENAAKVEGASNTSEPKPETIDSSSISRIDRISKLEEDEAMATAKITKTTAALEQANRRMIEFTKIANERKANNRREDQLSPCFRYWAALIRGKVLAPELQEVAELSMPNPTTSAKVPSDLLSQPMKEVLMATKDLGIGEYPDIAVVRDAFQCVGWCCLAFDLLMKKPKIDDLRCLAKLCDQVKLPEVKSVGMIKSMISRTSVWRAKVKKALAPMACETKPFNAVILKELGLGMSSIPVITPEEVILCNAIADEGERHCVCGGPRDEISMKCCFSCNKWYHPKCLNSVATDNWKCTFCEHSSNSTPKKKVKSNYPSAALWPFLGNGEDDVSPHAPKVKEIWPPFGLASSPEALTSLGLALTYKFEKMEKPTPKKPETIDEILRKASSASKPAKTRPQVTPVAQQPNKSQMPLKKSSNSATSSMLTMRFPSIVAGQGQNATSSTSPVTNKGPQVITGIIPTVSKPQNLSNGPLRNGEVTASQLMIKSVAPNGKTLPISNNINPISANKVISISSAPVVEGLATDVVQDALLVAQSVAEITPIIIPVPTIAVQNTVVPSLPAKGQNVSARVINQNGATAKVISVSSSATITSLQNDQPKGTSITNTSSPASNQTSEPSDPLINAPMTTNHIPPSNGTLHVVAKEPASNTVPALSVLNNPQISNKQAAITLTAPKENTSGSGANAMSGTEKIVKAEKPEIAKENYSTALNGVVADASNTAPNETTQQNATIATTSIASKQKEADAGI